jgi:outer membrane protein TolC
MKTFHALAFLFLPAISAAQTLTLEQYRALALQNNSELRQAQLQADAARQAERSAFTGYFPKLSAMGMVATTNIIPDLSVPYNLGVLGENHPYALSGLTLMQTLYAGGRVNNGNKLARIGLDAANEQLRMTHDDTVLQAEKKYRALAVLAEKKKTLAAYTAMVDALYSQVSQAAQQGVATHADLLRVALKKSQLAAQNAALDDGIAIARRDAAIFAGMAQSSSTFEVALDSGEITAPSYDARQFGARLALRPEYRLLKANADAAEKQRKMKNGEHLPTLTVGGALQRIDYMDYSTKTQTSLGFAFINVPLSDWWGGAHSTNELELKEKAAGEKLASGADYLVLDMQNRLDAWRQAYDSATASKLGVEEATANESELSDGYKNGTEKLSDYLNALAHSQESRDKLAEDSAAYFSARTAFKIAVTEME